VKVFLCSHLLYLQNILKKKYSFFFPEIFVARLVEKIDKIILK